MAYTPKELLHFHSSTELLKKRGSYNKREHISKAKKEAAMVSHEYRGRLTIFRRFKAHILMVLSQLGFCFMYFVTEAAFDHGLNPHVYVTYRHVVAAVVVFPVAYILERNRRPKLTFALLQEIFIMSLLGLSLPINMYFASLKYTSPPFVTSMINSIACITFIFAVILRLETLDIRRLQGVAKLLGTLLSLGGVLIMTLYQGPHLRTFVHPLLHIQGSKEIHQSWLKGSLLSVGGSITWSLSYIMQAYTLKRYPAQLSLTAWMCIVGAAQSAVFAVCMEHKPAAWMIGFNVDLLSIIYSGIVGSAVSIFFQLWVTREKGPVFATIFSPLETVIVAVAAYFVLGEKLYVGSLTGGVTVILGLYLFLWGKEEESADEAQLKSKESKLTDDQANATSAIKEEP